MCPPPYGPGVSEQIEFTILEPEAPVHYCLTCGHELTPGTHHKQPNQYCSSRRKWVLVCTGCGRIHTPDFWENPDTKGESYHG